MPRTRTLFTFCRLTLLLFLFASLVPITWLALPSPIADANLSAYSTKLLSEGETLTRVYETRSFYPTYLTNDHGYVIYAEDSLTDTFDSWAGRYFALHFSLDDPATGSVHTETGAPVPISVLHINNASLAIYPGVSAQQNADKDVEVDAIVDEGEGIVLPWFPMADRVLLQHSVDPHARNATVPLALRQSSSNDASEPRHVVEVLPVKAKQPEDSHLGSDQADQPLLRLTWTPRPSSSASANNVTPNNVTQSWEVSAEVPGLPFAGSPSRTYAFRNAMLSSMAPPILHLTSTYGHIFTWVIECIAFAIQWVFLIIYFFALAFCVLWLFIGRPALEVVLTWCNEKSRLRSTMVRRCCMRLENVREDHRLPGGELGGWWMGRAILGLDGDRVVLKDGEELVLRDVENDDTKRGKQDVETGL